MPKQLQAAKRCVKRVYCLESGIASIVANGKAPIEVGMIGRQGMMGTPSFSRTAIGVLGCLRIAL